VGGRGLGTEVEWRIRRRAACRRQPTSAACWPPSPRRISETGSNIENVSIEERDGLDTAHDFTITVRDRQHLARVMRRIRHIPLVLRISRAKS
jgi:hypothetical protein